MKAIKILQIATVAMFVLMVLAGIAVLVFAPDRIHVYGDLIRTLFPIFLTEVVPAMIGSPLTDAVRAIVAKRES